MSTPMKAAIHLGPNNSEILEVYKNTNFEEIQNLFGIAQKLVWDHPDEILNVKNTHAAIFELKFGQTKRRRSSHRLARANNRYVMAVTSTLLRTILCLQPNAFKTSRRSNW